MKKNTLLFCLTTLCGCQTVIEGYKNQLATLCTYEGAYSKGVQDSENDKESKATLTLSICPNASKPQALKGYNDGYMSGQTQEKNSLTQINIITESSQKKSSHTCEIKVFNNIFTAKGRTKSEALYNAQQACTSKKGDDFFCRNKDDYQCQKLY